MANWYVKNTGGYTKESSEGIHNATIIKNFLTARGWSINAICGVLGNIDVESGYNAWRWQRDLIQSTTSYTSFSMGYGLFQFSPAKKYIDGYGYSPEIQSWLINLTTHGANFSDRAGKNEDGQAQLLFVDRYADYISTSSYPESYQQFKISTQSADYLCRAWFYNYERSSETQTIPDRESASMYWYEYFTSGNLDLADVFYRYNGATEWDSVVGNIQTWYYGSYVKDNWCATSVSYMASQIGNQTSSELIPFLTYIAGKNANVYYMMMSCKQYAENNPEELVFFYDRNNLPTSLSKGDILFWLWSGTSMSVSSNKHVGVCYENVNISGNNPTIKCIGGNQSNSIRIATTSTNYYKKSQLYAVYRIGYNGTWINTPPSPPEPIPDPPEPSPTPQPEGLDIFQYLKPRRRLL